MKNIGAAKNMPLKSTQLAKRLPFPIEKGVAKKVFAVERSTSSEMTDLEIVEMLVTITTGSMEHAGTDADVYFEIGGYPTYLDTPDYDDFERGDTDSYWLNTPRMFLNTLRAAQIRLYHNNSGDHPGWYVAQVDLKVRYRDHSIFELYKRWGSVGWLAKDEPPHFTTEAILQDGQQSVPADG